MTIESNQGDYVQRQRFVNVIDFDKNGFRMIVGRMDLFAHKKCPTCYLMFNRKENFIALSESIKLIFAFTNAHDGIAERKHFWRKL